MPCLKELQESNCGIMDLMGILLTINCSNWHCTLYNSDGIFRKLAVYRKNTVISNSAQYWRSFAVILTELAMQGWNFSVAVAK
jgi:hypothetical protein